MLILVRHAMPRVVPDVPAERWELDGDGRRAARALAKALDLPAYHVSSDEPKALRPYRWVANHRELARGYVAGVRHNGWEPHDQVIARFDAAVSRHAAAAGGKTLIIGTHGMAPTVWLASRLRLEPSPEDFWERLEFPDLIAVDLSAGRVRRLLD